ncbi:MAG: acyl-CoA dehydrogenase family protein [Alphaproteobacteria bacterium]|nr:acyl-CoA dehydrogenase family protein [Alphaproteobacteria bacterium]
MDMQFTAADLAFRDEVRAFLATELPDDIRERWQNGSLIFPDRDDAVRWQKILHRKGWIAPNWPKEHGGPGWTVSQKFIFETEMAEAGAPPVIPLGLRMVGPVIMRYGTPEQKARFLPRILATDDYWCQGYSEPGSGSDLASLKTRAEKDGDDYVINGSKIWTTHAHFADWMFALVRTSTEGKPQQGITFLLIPMTTPGIEIRPLITLGGHHEVNQVFFTDVRVPQANRVGEENDGWTVAKYLLEFERGGNFYTGRINVNLARLRKLAERNGVADDPAFAKRLAELEVEAEAVSVSELRMLSSLTTGQNPGASASIIKLRGSEATQKATEMIMDAAGLYALPFEQLETAVGGDNEPPVAAPDEASSAGRYYGFRAATIFGGSSEVQRNILAKLSLGL